ncbi:MAG TPA: hypothetical protein VGX25_04205 [Actinophytocola sp.]|uniref:hypothetical protein n=1 Tax=Actinophytocola sp. TaxID=1872138 RepID=UPI002DDCBC0D|nr:hypothetical protein [Actinophytocola sp.]HEV2778582.1 hypothetical protein [Actinophytocola sp.]
MIEMQWTPELVKAEMDYRLQEARHGITVRAVRAGRRTAPGWVRRLRHRHG